MERRQRPRGGRVAVGILDVGQSSSLTLVPSWRKEGDPLCDAAISQMAADKSTYELDLLSKLEGLVSKDDDPSSPAHSFWKAVCESPPDDIRITDEEFERARALYLDHTVQISQAFLYYALGGGFAR